MRVGLTTMALLAGVLPAAVATADSPPPPPRPPESKTVCIEVYQPVCGTTDGKRITYSNSCFAKVAGATDISEGACSSASESPIHR